MVAGLPTPSPGAEATERLRHGCWLLSLILGISAVSLAVIGTFGLISPQETLAVVVIVAAVVLVRDRRFRRSRMEGDVES